MKEHSNQRNGRLLVHAFYSTAICILLSIFSLHAADNTKVTMSGRGWMQLGRIQQSSDTSVFIYNGNLLQSVAGQVTANADFNENWDAALGIGARQTHRAQSVASEAYKVKVNLDPFISEARFTYYYGSEKQNSPFKLTVGYFPYQYNSDVKNLGLYLLRGSVYPGYLFSGFELDETNGIANILGSRFYHKIGNFSQNLILSSETKIRPLFDYSLAYIADYKVQDVFTIGAGVNFYRLLPINEDLTTPTDPRLFTSVSVGADSANHPYDRAQYYIVDKKVQVNGVDTVIQEITTISLAGIKSDIFFSLNLAKLFGIEGLGAEDLKIYSEAAIIGIKDYPGIYTDIKKRIPVMVGFNFPTFKMLDHLSLEVEYYGAPYSSNYWKLENAFSPIPMSMWNTNQRSEYDSVEIHDKLTNNLLPADTAIDLTTMRVDSLKFYKDGSKMLPFDQPYDVENLTSDNIKWSIHASKTIKNHVRLSLQVANDHMRTGGHASTEDFAEAFSTTKDWYWMTKLSYFF